ncbi:MAG: hypothetical protein VX278_17135, partial [Myxococcota bacterium]|nr:hypothetical protein [Myxococcota bacterium]
MRKAFLLSLCWAILPAVPALIQNELIGSPYTDLYPSVWSLYAPWMSSKGFFYTTMLGYPEGMPLYSSALLKSFLALPLSLLLEPHHIYNFFILLSRFLGPFFAFFSARAWGYKETASLGFALFFGAAPYFHGYAVEGIIEGVDAWPIALWLWSVASGKRLLMALSLALSVLCSWYLGASVCLLTLLFSIEKRDTLFSFFGLLLAAPFVYVFTQNF